MKEVLYEIVAMRRSNHGKWVFTARPVGNNEISFECSSKELEDNLFNHARETMYLGWDDTRGYNVLDHFTIELKGGESTIKAENVFKSGVKCKICGAQPSIVTPIGYAYCESCVTALYGLHKSNRCTHCGKSLNQEVVSKGDDVFCSIDCAVTHKLKEGIER